VRLESTFKPSPRRSRPIVMAVHRRPTLYALLIFGFPGFLAASAEGMRLISIWRSGKDQPSVLAMRKNQVTAFLPKFRLT